MSHQITVHHLNSSRSERLFWVLEELGLPYNVKVHFRTETNSSPKSLLDISPTGKSPCLELDGEILTESSFIVHKLLNLPDVKDKSNTVNLIETEQDNFWSHYAEASMLNLMQSTAIIKVMSTTWIQGKTDDENGNNLNEGNKKAVQDFTSYLTGKVIGSQLQQSINFAEKFLTKENSTGWFSGTENPGEGDFLMFFAINAFVAGKAKGVFQIGEGFKGWHKRVMERPAAQKAVKREQDELAKAQSA
ncbi:uncharacterized protein L201_001911 [Kwoniella dendrophila CBS 6074]|uniref:Glutathione transferase n=1 Tax=Kwoniella dendrophila CBS 6074 TaxID=1295534 RepID=A0AAX4JRA0_9TREE